MAPSIFNDEYIKNLSLKLAKDNKKCYISGDFNLNLMTAENHADTFEFLEVMTTNFLLPTITIPTRNYSHNNTLIDTYFPVKSTLT